MSDCECGLPSSALVLNVLHVVEYMDDKGEIWKIDLSHDNGGEEISAGKAFELSEWAKMFHQAEILGEMVRDYVFGCDDDDDDGSQPAYVK